MTNNTARISTPSPPTHPIPGGKRTSIDRLFHYFYAVLLIGAALAATRLLSPYIAPHTSPPYFLAVMFASLIGGAGPGLLATLLASLALAYFDLGSTARLDLGIDDFIRLSVFSTSALVISSVSAARKRAESELRLALQELAALDRAKDEFIAAVSHELRTPLTSILGWAQILRQIGSADEALRSTALQSIESSARAQSMIVNDLLEVSRMVLKKLQLNRQPALLRDVVEEGIDVVRPAAEAKQISIVERFGGNFAAYADRERFKQVVWNLLSNAVKFTPQGGRIEIDLRQENRHAILRVSDNGMGIAPEFLPHIFERFRQGPETSRQEGLGLGLAIARHIVELHGGNIVARSDGPGKGAAFTVRIPLMIAAIDKPAMQGKTGGSADPMRG